MFNIYDLPSHNNLLCFLETRGPYCNEDDEVQWSMTQNSLQYNSKLIKSKKYYANEGTIAEILHHCKRSKILSLRFYPRDSSAQHA